MKQSKKNNKQSKKNNRKKRLTRKIKGGNESNYAIMGFLNRFKSYLKKYREKNEKVNKELIKFCIKNNFFPKKFDNEYTMDIFLKHSVVGTIHIEKKDKQQYFGQVDNDAPNGIGICIWGNNNQINIYIGEFVNGKMTGYGKVSTFTRILRPNLKFKRQTYEGDVKKSFGHGEGVIEYDNEDKYIGTLKQDFRHGQGTYRYADGDVYEGQYENDQRHGQGTFRYANGNVYNGQYENAEQHGQGTLTYANGDVYKGQFENDQRHGLGTLTYANTGIIEEGQWVEDQFVGDVGSDNMQTDQTPHLDQDL